MKKPRNGQECDLEEGKTEVQQKREKWQTKQNGKEEQKNLKLKNSP
jgi:hypothetical protein